MNSDNIKLKEVHNGFSERDIHSKAIISKDSDALLKYKIQKNRMSHIASNARELETMRTEFNSLREELGEIKHLLLKITTGKQ